MCIHFTLMYTFYSHYNTDRIAYTVNPNNSVIKRLFLCFMFTGNGFIDSSLLGDILSALDLVSEKE